MSSLEIEDVLASIRRLVSEDLRPANRPGSIGKLMLTPALRVVSQTGVVDREDAPLDRAGAPAADAAVLRDDWVPDQSSLSAVEDHEADHLDFSAAAQLATPQRGPVARTAMQMAAESFHAQADEFILSYSDSGTLVLRGEPAGAEARGGTDHGAVFAALSKADMAAKIPPVEALADAEGGAPVDDDANWSTVDWDAAPSDADQTNAPVADDAAAIWAASSKPDTVISAPVREAQGNVVPGELNIVSPDPHTDPRENVAEVRRSPDHMPEPTNAPNLNVDEAAPDEPVIAETEPVPPAFGIAPDNRGSDGPLILPFVSARRTQGAEVLTLRRPLLQVIGVNSGTDAHDTLAAPLVLRPAGGRPSVPDPEAAPSNWPGEGDIADQDATAAAAQFFRDAVSEGQGDGQDYDSNWSGAVVDRGPDAEIMEPASETSAPLADGQSAKEETAASLADPVPLMTDEGAEPRPGDIAEPVEHHPVETVAPSVAGQGATSTDIWDDGRLLATHHGVPEILSSDQSAESANARAIEPEPVPAEPDSENKPATSASSPSDVGDLLPDSNPSPDDGNTTTAADLATPMAEAETAWTVETSDRQADAAQNAVAVTVTRPAQALETTPVLDTLGETLKAAAARAKSPVNLGEAAFTRWPGWAQTDHDDIETAPSAIMPLPVPPVPVASRKKPKAAVQDLGWADRAEAEIHRQLAAELGPSALSGVAAPAQGLQLSEAALRDLVRDLIREELTGKLGERITQNVRKLVQMELQKTMSLQVGEFRSQRRDPS